MKRTLAILFFFLAVRLCSAQSTPTPTPAPPALQQSPSTDTSGLYDQTSGDYRPLLADIRQALWWLVGLQLVSLTVHAFKEVK